MNLRRIIIIVLAPVFYTIVGIVFAILIILFLLAAGSMKLLYLTPSEYLPKFLRTLRTTTRHYEPMPEWMR